MSTNTPVSLSYADAGVDMVAGDALVDAIKPFAKRTMREGVMAGIGGFGARGSGGGGGGAGVTAGIGGKGGNGFTGWTGLPAAFCINAVAQ